MSKRGVTLHIDPQSSILSRGGRALYKAANHILEQQETTVSTSYDESREHALCQGDARLAVKAISDLLYEPLRETDKQALTRVRDALSAFASGSTSIVPEE
jgi:hypothetical protein